MIEFKEFRDLIRSNEEKMAPLVEKVKYYYKDRAEDCQELPQFYPIETLQKSHEEVYDKIENVFCYGEYNFFAYCICNYLGVESGVSLDDAYTCIDNLVEEGNEEYPEALKNCPLLDEDGIDEDAREVAEDAIVKGIDPKELVWIDEDTSWEVWEASTSDVFATMCGCTELANKLKPLVERGTWLNDRMIFM